MYVYCKNIENVQKDSVSKAKTTVFSTNKAGYTATLVACRWAGAVLQKVTRASGKEPYAQKAQKRQKSMKGTDQLTD